MCDWDAEDSPAGEPRLWWVPPSAAAAVSTPKPIPPSRGANLAAQLYSASALEAPLARVEAPPRKTKSTKKAASATSVSIDPMPVTTSVTAPAKPKAAKKAAARPKIAKPKKAPSAVKPSGVKKKKKTPSGSAAIARAINAAARSTPKGGVITIKIQK